MKKNEMVVHVAMVADITKAQAARALEAVVDGITAGLKSGDPVALQGLGTFVVSRRAERTGRNPRTGTSMKIAAAKVPKFRPARRLRDALK